MASHAEPESYLCEASTILVALGHGFRLYWILALLLLSLPFLHFGVVLGEERYLERKFGRAYVDYKARVPRWL